MIQLFGGTTNGERLRACQKKKKKNGDKIQKKKKL
jgi:hypothetical protein